MTCKKNKNHNSFSICEKYIVQTFCNAFMIRIMFLLRKLLLQKVLPNLVNKTNIYFVKICKYYFLTTSFDLWKSKGAHSIFVLVTIFFRVDWQPKPKHITISLFTTSEIIEQFLTKKNLIALLDEYEFFFKIVACVKNKKTNLNATIVTLKSMITCITRKISQYNKSIFDW